MYILTKKTLCIVHQKHRNNVVLCKMKFYFHTTNACISTLFKSLRPDSVLRSEAKTLLNITTHIHLYLSSRLNFRLYQPQEYIRMGV
jgi:hypothetical protein